MFFAGDSGGLVPAGRAGAGADMEVSEPGLGRSSLLKRGSQQPVARSPEGMAA